MFRLSKSTRDPTPPETNIDPGNKNKNDSKNNNNKKERKEKKQQQQQQMEEIKKE